MIMVTPKNRPAAVEVDEPGESDTFNVFFVLPDKISV